ncbi:MAG TPA: hypothetical protein VHT95_12180 [Vicinamibacterales bacterium]|nr:hypothetical protein [Vicinamibacterales bacterium]
MRRKSFGLTTRLGVALAAAFFALAPAADTDSPPRFELVQPELFGATGGQPNAWADFDNDGDLDEFVWFRGRPNRLYRQDHGRFEDVAAAVGLGAARVDVEVTTMSKRGRQVTKRPGVDPRTASRPLVIRVSDR